MTARFHITRLVEFNHCDPAGIVFYPRYFEMISALVERFMADGLGHPWAGMLAQGNGSPMGDIQIRFDAPSRLGDVLDIDLGVTRIGRASATLDLRCLSSGMRRFGGTATLVHANLETGRSLPWPDDLRDRMGAYLHTPKKVKEPT